jgi:tetratricopeptide repeat protein
MKTNTRVTCVVLVVLAAIGNARASTEIGDAISPDKKWELRMKAEEFRCKLFVRNSASRKVVLTLDVDEFDADNVRDTITAHWRGDSTAVALDIEKGRSITDCEILMFANGQWKRVTFAENELKEVRKKNNTENGKSQDYVTFASWLPDGVKINYQGNTEAVEELDFRIVPGAKPHLRLMSIADYTHAIEMDPRCGDCYSSRASAYAEKRQYEPAIKDLEKAIQLDPKKEHYYLNLGWYQLFNRKPREAIAASLKALELSPEDTAARIDLAHAYLFDNQFEKAKAIYLENKDAKDSVLRDFKELEGEGVTHPDMEKIKALLDTGDTR